LKHESKLHHIVTLSRPYRRSNSPRNELLDIVDACPLEIKRCDYSDVFIPVSQSEYDSLCSSGVQCVEYGGHLCKASVVANVLIEGEYDLDTVEKAFNNEQDHIRVFIDFFYEAS